MTFRYFVIRMFSVKAMTELLVLLLSSSKVMSLGFLFQDINASDFALEHNLFSKIRKFLTIGKGKAYTNFSLQPICKHL